ncbi:hypothetical protein CVT26_003642 [Gymnopilus dilepis]|uniref:EF-hand domain-containing protein n=1 Tax=Gymnopilus dilepis TaxID=231916 RepID=A0A409VSF6_9AGAR|nr:hypothetical protein CVT26_003642 [Gymnopilus dilepis]
MVAPPDGASPAPGKGYEQGKGNTGLQQHVAYFDRDNDGVIWPQDTYIGFRDIKFGVFLSLLAMCIIHGGFSYTTCGSWIPDPFFRLKIKYMHRAKHGSDSEAYDTLGDFDNERFNKIFDMYSSAPHTHLTFTQGVRMLHGNMNPFDFFGWFAAAFEWLATYLMLWPTDPQGISKEDVSGVYDVNISIYSEVNILRANNITQGSIFYKISGRKPKY